MLEGQTLEGADVSSNLQVGQVGDGGRGGQMLKGRMLEGRMLEGRMLEGQVLESQVPEGVGVSSHLLGVGEAGGRRGWRWTAR
jgi:hypothetical protein